MTSLFIQGFVCKRRKLKFGKRRESVRTLSRITQTIVFLLVNRTLKCHNKSLAVSTRLYFKTMEGKLKIYRIAFDKWKKSSKGKSPAALKENIFSNEAKQRRQLRRAKETKKKGRKKTSPTGMHPGPDKAV